VHKEKGRSRVPGQKEKIFSCVSFFGAEKLEKNYF
jgi:hypothetical protein